MPDFVLFTEASVQLQAAQACPCSMCEYMCTVVDGRGIVRCRLTPDPSNPSQAFDGDHGTPIFTQPETQLVSPSPDIFSLDGKGKSVLLLDNVERGRAWLVS